MLAYALEVAADEIARLAREGWGGKEKEERKMKDRPATDAPDVEVKMEDVEQVPDADGDVVMKTEGDGVQEEEEEEEESPSPPPPSASNGPSTKEGEVEEEDPVMKKLRLNLLALAKRAPLDQIMKLPPELVPAHLRHIVPTTDK